MADFNDYTEDREKWEEDGFEEVDWLPMWSSYSRMGDFHQRARRVRCMHCSIDIWSVYYTCIACHGYNICRKCHDKRNNPNVTSRPLCKEGHETLRMVPGSPFVAYTGYYRGRRMPLPLDEAKALLQDTTGSPWQHPPRQTNPSLVTYAAFSQQREGIPP
jgi:hypothetical protein